jgi:hypothetical protein
MRNKNFSKNEVKIKAEDYPLVKELSVLII